VDWQTELKEYIASCLKLGFSKDEIRSALRSVGWKDNDIERGFSAISSVIPISHISPPVTPISPITPISPSVIPAKAGIQTGFPIGPALDYDRGLGMTDKNKKSKDRVKMLSADKTPNLLLPPSDEKFPPVVKTAIPLLLSLLSRRAEALKRVKRIIQRKPAIKLLSGTKRGALAIETAHLPQPLLLAAPSLRTIWFGRFQLITERVFSKIESVAVVAGKFVLLPVALFGLAVRALGDISYAVSARYGKATAEKPRVGQAVAPVSPATMLIGKKFPEHIVARDIFKLAGRMFRTRRLRTFLTISGISVGIGTILFLVSFGYGLQNILFERITTQEALLTLDVVPPADNGVVAIDDSAIEEMRKMEEVADVSKMVALNGEMEFGGSSAAGFIYAVDATYMRVTGVKPEVGRIIDSENDSGAVISTAAMKLLGWDGGPESALDKELSFVISLPKENGGIETIALEGRFKITGAVDDPMSVFVYLPIEKTSGLKLPPYSQLKVKVKDTALLDPARDKILKMGFLVSMLSETVDQAKKVFNAVKLVLGLFGVITLIVSAIGMLNTLTIALLERTQEVGIMKAVGASNFDIWKLFLAEAILMGFLGGVGGIVVGFLSAEIFNYGINLLAKTFGGQALNLFQTPTWFILTIIAFSSCIGIITGLWPARRAAGLDPLDALKYK